VRRRPAMHDVARVAGVSHQTVSRVLNAHPSVRPGTRERVLAAIEELGYRPNSAARALVTGGSRMPDPVAGLPVVSVDNLAGARSATGHLLALGHRSVWHLGGPPGWYEAYERSTGWSTALTSAGVEAPPALTGDWSPRAGYQAGQMLAQMPDVTAVFAANDQMALGLLRALHERGRRVPEDVSVVGFDDIPEAGYLTPPLTTVRQPFDALGRQGLQSLLSQAQSGRPADLRVVLEPQLGGAGEHLAASGLGLPLS
jgi:DNA-binding LacI/PurR family transcriptional regulator